MLQLHPERILRNHPQLRLHVRLHARPQTQPLPHLTDPEHDIRQPHRELKLRMAPAIRDPLPPLQVRRVHQGPRRPIPGQPNAIDRRPQELVVALHDAHVAADEDELARPLALVCQHIADPLEHALLHLVMALGARPSLQVRRDPALRAPVPALVRPHQRRRREQVRMPHPPLQTDARQRRIVEGQQRLPELRVLLAEAGRHRDVQPVVDEHQLRVAGWQTSDEDVARVRVAVHQPPDEHLRREQVDHRRHDFLERQPETAVAARPAPRVAVGLEGCGLRAVAKLLDDDLAVWCVQRCASYAGRSLSVPAFPGRRDPVFVPEPHAFDPFGSHDALG